MLQVEKEIVSTLHNQCSWQSKNFLYLPIVLETTNTSKIFSLQTLVDSGAMRIFINQSFVEKYYMKTYKLLKLIPIYNVDGTSNEDSQI